MIQPWLLDNVIVTDGVEVGYYFEKKKIAVEAGVDGIRVGCPNRIDEHCNRRQSKIYDGRPNR